MAWLLVAAIPVCLAQPATAAPAPAAAQAPGCAKPRTRIEKAVCASPQLRQQETALEKAFAEVLARLPGKDRDLRASQAEWATDRDAGCATPDPKVLTRCLEAQYRSRLQTLSIMNAAARAVAPPAPQAPPVSQPAPPPAAAANAAAPKIPPPPVTDDTVHPAVYVSDAVTLDLAPDGSFEMKQLGGSKRAVGHYAYSNGALTLLDGKGDVGKTHFPLRCQVQRTVNGFAVTLGQSACSPLDGIAFRVTS